MRVLVGFSDMEYSNVEKLATLGDCRFIRYDRDYLLRNIHKYDIFVPHLFEEVDAEIITRATNLKVLATPSTGKDHIDTDALKECGIHFISLNDDRSFINEITSTAEMNWLLILACMRNLRDLLDRVQSHKSWVNTDIRGFEMNNKTLGIIGYGRLGKMVARYGKCFGMRVLAYDTDNNQYDCEVEALGLETLYNVSDVISLNTKFNPTSANMINMKALAMMKQGVVIVNTARGGIVESEAIIDGLESGKIAAIGLDVCNEEYESSQLPKDPLVERSFTDNRIIITPHAGGSTLDAHGKVFGKVAELIVNYLSEQEV